MRSKNRYIKAYISIIIIVVVSVVGSFLLFSRRGNYKNVIYIYDDKGVGRESLLHVKNSINDLSRDEYRGLYIVKNIDAKMVKENTWVKDAALFIMPGGADLPYVEKLNGRGNENIKNYVEKGGSFLGICAGAYYGSAFVDFDRNGELEVIGERELSFFPGKAVGPVLSKYDYKSNSGARVADLKIEGYKNKKPHILTYYNGGGYFEDVEYYSNNVSVIARYANDLPAIIYVRYGMGNVVLSGVHFEYSPYLLDKDDIFLKDIIVELEHSDEVRRDFFTDIVKELLLNYREF